MAGLRADVGLDFGMTNSLIAYYSTGAHWPEMFVPKGAESPVVRTLVSDPDAPLLERVIGQFVHSMRDLFKSKRIHHNFKVGLPRAWEVTTNRGDDPDFKCARAFLERLFDEFAESTPGGFEPASIVVTGQSQSVPSVSTSHG